MSSLAKVLLGLSLIKAAQLFAKAIIHGPVQGSFVKRQYHF
jgi:hypothetical protein